MSTDDFHYKPRPQWGVPYRYEPKKPFVSQGIWDWIGTLGQSTGWGAAEVFGLKPPERIEAFRESSPFAGFASEALGFTIPYIGMYKFSQIPRLAKLLQGAVKGISSPVVQGIARETLRMAPLEATRFVTGTTVGQRPPGEMLLDNAMSLTAEALFGGVSGALAKGGKRRMLMEEALGDIDLGQPTPVLLRKLRETIANTTDEASLAQLRNMEATVDARIRQEYAGPGSIPLMRKARPEGASPFAPVPVTEFPLIQTSVQQKYTLYIHPLLEVEGKIPNQRALNSLFVTNAQLPSGTRRGPFQVKRLLVDAVDGLDSQEALLELTGSVGLTQEFTSHVRFPRIGIDTSGTGSMTKLIQENTRSVGDGVRHVQEADGLHVIFKPVPKKFPVERGIQEVDSWVYFKTDDPGQFVKSSEGWINTIAEKSAWDQLPGVRTPGADLEIYDTLYKLLNDQELTNLLAIERAGPKGRMTVIAEHFGLDKLFDKAVVQDIAEAMDAYITPRSHQLGKRVLGRRVLDTVTNAKDIMHDTLNRDFYGYYTFDPKKNKVMQGILGTLPAKENSLYELGKKLTVEEANVYREITALGAPIDETVKDLLAKGEISDNLYKFAMRAHEMDGRYNWKDISVARLVGEADFIPRIGHGLLPRTWRGDFRVSVHAEGGEVVEMVGGTTAEAAQREGQAYLARSRKAGLKHYSSEPFLVNRHDDAAFTSRAFYEQAIGNKLYIDAAKVREALRPKTGKPLTYRPRTGVPGYIQEYKSVDEMLKVMHDHLNDRIRYSTEKSLNLIIEPHMQNLYNFGDQHSVNVIRDSMARTFDRPGPAAKAQNEFMDKALGKVLGKNSASKIAAMANKVEMHMRLGSGNLAYSSIAALTFMQTVLPMVSWSIHTPVSRMRRYFSYLPVFAGGKPVRGIAAPNVLSVMKQSMKELGNPDAMSLRMWNRASNDGTVEAIEEFISKISADKIISKEILSDPKRWGEAMMQLSALGIGGPERLSRIHSLQTGIIVGRDVLGLAADEDLLYRFAKDFCDRTMYRYAKADKSRIFTGPIGSILGLFKHWQISYMYGFGMYASEAFQYGNIRPLLWQLAGTTALGGLAAAPFYGIADAFSMFATKEHLMEHIYSTFNGDDGNTIASDAVLMGLPSLLGLSLSTQAQAPFSNPMRDASQLFTFVHLDRAAALGNVIGEAGDYVTTSGEWNVLQSPQVRDKLARATTPRTVYRALQVAAGNGLRSLNTGYPLVKDMSLGELAYYVAGFAPTRVQRTFQLSHEMWEDLNLRRQRTADYGKAWAYAQERGDTEELHRIWRRCIAEGLDVDSVVKSALTRLSKGYEDMIERMASPELLHSRWDSLGKPKM